MGDGPTSNNGLKMVVVVDEDDDEIKGNIFINLFYLFTYYLKNE